MLVQPAAESVQLTEHPQKRDMPSSDWQLQPQPAAERMHMHASQPHHQQMSCRQLQGAQTFGPGSKQQQQQGAAAPAMAAGPRKQPSLQQITLRDFLQMAGAAAAGDVARLVDDHSNHLMNTSLRRPMHGSSCLFGTACPVSSCSGFCGRGFNRTEQSVNSHQWTFSCFLVN